MLKSDFVNKYEALITVVFKFCCQSMQVIFAFFLAPCSVRFLWRRAERVLSYCPMKYLQHCDILLLRRQDKTKIWKKREHGFFIRVKNEGFLRMIYFLANSRISYSQKWLQNSWMSMMRSSTASTWNGIFTTIFLVIRLLQMIYNSVKSLRCCRSLCVKKQKMLARKVSIEIQDPVFVHGDGHIKSFSFERNVTSWILSRVRHRTFFQRATLQFVFSCIYTV